MITLQRTSSGTAACWLPLGCSMTACLHLELPATPKPLFWADWVKDIFPFVESLTSALEDRLLVSGVAKGARPLRTKLLSRRSRLSSNAPSFRTLYESVKLVSMTSFVGIDSDSLLGVLFECWLGSSTRCGFCGPVVVRRLSSASSILSGI